LDIVEQKKKQMICNVISFAALENVMGVSFFIKEKKGWLVGN